MEFETMQLIAGFTSSILFAGGQVPMLAKVFKTKNAQSYSPINLVICNFGNLIHWIYLVTIPIGPLWYLHGFFTLTTAVMLLFYVRYEWWPQNRKEGGRWNGTENRRLTQVTAVSPSS